MKSNIESNPQQPFQRTPVPENPTMNEWFKTFKDRQKKFETGRNEVELSFVVPAVLNFISDWHIGHPSTHYKRIEDEVNAIDRANNSYAVTVGDLIDNLNWNPGQMEQMEQTPEQLGFMWSILKHLISNEKLIHVIEGDHDADWLMRGGYSMKRELQDGGVSTSRGHTYLSVDVQKQHYDVMAAHQLPGSSMYNRNHPQSRAMRGAGHGADAIISGHNHQKGMSETFSYELGKPKDVTLVALGSYKPTDSWLAKKGYPAQESQEMYGVSLYFDGKTHDIVADMDIVRMNNRMRRGK
jgi:UDP-2,3-diacylglucosamine pyrophosphatase LpxH